MTARTIIIILALVHSGGDIAKRLYDTYVNDKLPWGLEAVDKAIKPTVKVAIGLEAPIEAGHY